jgi:hypothetical protein
MQRSSDASDGYGRYRGTIRLTYKRRPHDAKDALSQLPSTRRNLGLLSNPGLFVMEIDHFAAHKTVKHSAGEYVRTDFDFSADDGEFSAEKVHVNSAEGYFSIFKRGMRGVYQHCKEKHLHRSLQSSTEAFSFSEATNASITVFKKLAVREPFKIGDPINQNRAAFS